MSNPVVTGMKRGFLGRCPQCGEGRLFRAYLKVDPICAGCSHDNSQYKADDGPAYFTMVLVGHLVIAPLLLFPIIWQANPWVVVAVTLPLLAAVTLSLLPVIKGATVGLLWGLGLKGQHR